eukprot:893212-Amorphochlora_amoeboformis.AAC.1
MSPALPLGPMRQLDGPRCHKYTCVTATAGHCRVVFVTNPSVTKYVTFTSRVHGRTPWHIARPPWAGRRHLGTDSKVWCWFRSSYPSDFHLPLPIYQQTRANSFVGGSHKIVGPARAGSLFWGSVGLHRVFQSPRTQRYAALKKSQVPREKNVGWGQSFDPFEASFESSFEEDEDEEAAAEGEGIRQVEKVQEGRRVDTLTILSAQFLVSLLWIPRFNKKD